MEVTQDYQILKKIGKGSFGTVVEAKCRQTGITVAIKCIEGFAEYDYDCVKLVREIQIMKQI
jgi:serine/threonine protein kinase